MWRFATAVTAVELILTGFTAALLSFESEPDPYLTRDDLAEYSLAFENFETARRIRFDALHSFDSTFTLLHPRQAVWISVRVDQTDVDFLARRRREENWATKPGFGTSTILDDPGHGDLGYSVRHRSATAARCELVRFKGDRMLVVKVSQSEAPDASDESLAVCERRGRLLQAKMLQKLRWWSTPLTAGPR